MSSERQRAAALAYYYRDQANSKRLARANNTRRYAKRRKAKLCQECGARSRGKAFCRVCARKRVARTVAGNRRIRNIKWLAGMCQDCRRSRVEGRLRCEDCLAAARLAQQRRRARRETIVSTARRA